MNEQIKTKVAIIGGGITGYAFAWFLTLKTNYEITIIEKNSTTGGLAMGIDTPYGFTVDKFYHFLYKNDSKNTLDFFAKLGLIPQVIWSNITSAVYKDEVLFSVDEIRSLLKVKLLSPQDKWRFLLGMLRTIIVNYKKLDTISSKEYLIKIFGPNNYRVIWEPLMVAKFSEYTDQVPASWIARRIQVTFFSRSLSGKTRYGYIVGTYNPLFKALTEQLTAKKVTFINDQANKVTQQGSDVIVETQSNGQLEFNKVVIATPINIAQKIINHPEIQHRIAKFKDLNAFVVLLLMKKQFSNYFWININEAKIPFTGIIELTNLTGPKLFKNYHIVYVVQYLSDKSKFNREKALANLPSYLKTINPQFQDSDIVEQFEGFAPGAAPIPFLNYLSEMPTFQTAQSRIFMLNSSMIYPQDRGVGNSIKLAERHVDEFIKR